ncbi:protein kinase domain-containing protein [Streptacidiphilus fuscans]|uniref:non-specific serine/threonine protein kinase n=1 Tax=Streptacidiphilus fuscans TaxID=2789292 RepID=A0A931FFB2_9ACTN|nr:protein kinase [Streptacidiphilus fuscans]MBF9068254.1 protein kinase [Streptacidiphilus fuscans]
MSEQGGADGAGRTVGHGRYVLRDLLGQGGMATVHLADDTVLDRPVAVKTMLGEMSREPSFRERFRREAQAVARLNHTNIVAVYDSGEDDTDGTPVPFIVMEYVEGSSLSSVLRKDITELGAMPTEKALKITADVLAALSASHEEGLVHRDIKPANVMLTKRGVVKVMDFGIARAMQSGVTSMTQTGMVVGTPQYLSPEQALGKSVDARSDLYSVGCMLFELLTGRLPFESESALGMAYQHVQETPPAPSSMNAAIPPAVDALVARALRKDPSHRFPTADAMREECQRVAQSAGTAANQPQMLVDGPHQSQVGGSGQNAVFPQAQGPLNTPMPPVQTPYPQQMAPQHMGQNMGPQHMGQNMGPQHMGQTPPPYPQRPTPPPFAQQPQPTPPPFAQQRPAPTPPPFAQQRPTPPPFNQARPTPVPQRPTPPPFAQPRPPAPTQAPYVPSGAPQTDAARGCGRLVLILAIVGVLFVGLIIVIAVIAASNSSSDNTGGLGRTPVVGAVQVDRGV